MKTVYLFLTVFIVGLSNLVLSTPLPDEPHPNGPTVTTIEEDIEAYEAAIARWNAAHNETELEKRAGSPYTVFLCNQHNWGEPCVNWVFSSGQHGKFLKKPFDIWSIGPHKGVTAQYVTRHITNDGVDTNFHYTYSSTINYPGWATADYWPYASDFFRAWW